MFTIRRAAPLLSRSVSRNGSVVLKAAAVHISATASTHRIGSITNRVVADRHSKPLASSNSKRMMTTLKDSYDHILAEKRLPEISANGGGVGLITLHRPKALNALCDALFEDLIHAVSAFDEDEDVGCIVITGSPKAFAAGECYQSLNIGTLQPTT
eukprot:scaffold21566_cov73-Cyclotella_meneghiniana.AAC.16